jgi:peptide/nickel transport system permease protein
MSTVEETQVQASVEELFDQRTWLQRTAAIARKNPLGVFGAGVVVIMIVSAIFAPWLSPHNPESNAFEFMLVPPSTDFWLGTDQFGRDVLTRIIYGARTALFVGFTAAFVGSFIGLILGVGSAYFAGKIDLIFQRVMDVFMAFPLIITITIPFIPRCARVVRSNALAIREIPYVDAARAMGFSHLRIIIRHMAPNVMAPFLIMITAFVGQAILLEASLSYLGLGVQEPTPAWGLMLQGGAEEYVESAPWVAVFPGLAISLAVFGFNLFGDAVRDTLDPRLRSQ